MLHTKKDLVPTYYSNLIKCMNNNFIKLESEYFIHFSLYFLFMSTFKFFIVICRCIQALLEENIYLYLNWSKHFQFLHFEKHEMWQFWWKIKYLYRIKQNFLNKNIGAMMDAEIIFYILIHDYHVFVNICKLFIASKNIVFFCCCLI